MNIPITKAVFGPEELRAVQLPLETGWVVQGPYVRRFEERFAAYTAGRHAAATSSCTTALHLAVAALGLGPGDEVIVPAFTWVSTANVVEYMGARPVFCDIDVRTFNLDVGQVASLITPRTVGILPVHLFGLCADMDPLLDLARKHHLWVVEDAACGFGAWYRGKHAGTFGAAGCFSFHPRKAITTGEGGMVLTGDPDLDRMVRCLRDHGASRSDHARHHATASFLLAEYNHLGYNYRLTDIQGALGAAQMDRAGAIMADRTRWAERYRDALAGLDWLELPHVPAGCVHGYQSFVCLFRPDRPTVQNADRLNERRNALMARLEALGIATRQGTHAPVLLGYYADKYNLRPGRFPGAVVAERLSLTLPLYAQMTEAEHDYVCQHLRHAPDAARAA